MGVFSNFTVYFVKYKEDIHVPSCWNITAKNYRLNFFIAMLFSPLCDIKSTQSDAIYSHAHNNWRDNLLRP